LVIVAKYLARQIAQVYFVMFLGGHFVVACLVVTVVSFCEFVNSEFVNFG
jgi:hypothetical protein